jgi:hypothetical protein
MNGNHEFSKEILNFWINYFLLKSKVVNSSPFEPIKQEVEPWYIRGGNGSKGNFWVNKDYEGLI